MDEWLAKEFQENRAHLRGVAYRMLGSSSEADDAVQEVWLRLAKSNTDEVVNLRGWLTTVIARVCLDALRARKSRREEGHAVPEPVSTHDPEGEMAIADSVGLALLVVLETLTPAERVAFVLHDMFEVPFEQIAPIVGRSPDAARQLASRARRRVRGSEAPEGATAQHREIVGAFLAASRDGDFEALLAVLSPEVVLRVDPTVIQEAAANNWGSPLASEVCGASAVAQTFVGRVRGALPASIDGEAGAVWAIGGRTRSAWVFRIEGGKVTGIDLIMDPARLSELAIEVGVESRDNGRARSEGVR